VAGQKRQQQQQQKQQQAGRQAGRQARSRNTAMLMQPAGNMLTSNALHDLYRLQILVCN